MVKGYGDPYYRWMRTIKNKNRILIQLQSCLENSAKMKWIEMKKTFKCLEFGINDYYFVFVSIVFKP